jgi:hypothetical protein
MSGGQAEGEGEMKEAANRGGLLPLSGDKQRNGCAYQNQKSGQRTRDAYPLKYDHDISPDAIPWEQS